MGFYENFSWQLFINIIPQIINSIFIKLLSMYLKKNMAIATLFIIHNIRLLR